MPNSKGVMVQAAQAKGRGVQEGGKARGERLSNRSARGPAFKRDFTPKCLRKLSANEGKTRSSNETEDQRGGRKQRRGVDKRKKGVECNGPKEGFFIQKGFIPKKEGRKSSEGEHPLKGRKKKEGRNKKKGERW